MARKDNAKTDSDETKVQAQVGKLPDPPAPNADDDETEAHVRAMERGQGESDAQFEERKRAVRERVERNRQEAAEQSARNAGITVTEYVRPSRVPAGAALAPEVQTNPTDDDPNAVIPSHDGTLSHGSGGRAAGEVGIVHVRPPDAPLTSSLAPETTAPEAGSDVDPNAVRRGDGPDRFKTSDEGGPTSDNPDANPMVGRPAIALPHSPDKR